MILLTSDQRPFRVTEVVWSPLGEKPELPARASQLHKIVLRIDPSRIEPRGEASELIFRTDHPDQPSVGVKIVVLEGGEKEAER